MPRSSPRSRYVTLVASGGMTCNRCLKMYKSVSKQEEEKRQPGFNREEGNRPRSSPRGVAVVSCSSVPVLSFEMDL